MSVWIIVLLLFLLIGSLLMSFNQSKMIDNFENQYQTYDGDVLYFYGPPYFYPKYFPGPPYNYGYPYYFRAPFF